jgi:hypothetical protein
LSASALLPLHGLAGAPPVPIPQDGELVLGRDPGGAGVKIADPRCSRKHAKLFWRDGRLYAKDLGSKNGTWVNGKRIKEIQLQPGDNLRIGHAEFAFAPPGEAYRCASCLQTVMVAPPESPFCNECKRSFPLLGSTLGQRRLVRGLGTGSFGSVYVGHHRGTPYVAVKVLHVEFTETPDVVMKFLKEAYATSGLEHENIVRFGDSGHEAGHWYILLEYFPSESLKEVLEERRFLPVEEGLNIARQVLSALDYAHQRKLLHRDIKPGNILLDDNGRVKVVDFGLAKRLVDSAFTSQTTTGMPGTPLFMAPELLQGGTATFRADIYSAAATIFRMLTGRHPIEAKKLNEWLQAIQTQVPPPANSIREDIPQQIADALAKALSKNPRDRQTTIAELIADLGL